MRDALLLQALASAWMYFRMAWRASVGSSRNIRHSRLDSILRTTRARIRGASQRAEDLCGDVAAASQTANYFTETPLLCSESRAELPQTLLRPKTLLEKLVDPILDLRRVAARDA